VTEPPGLGVSASAPTGSGSHDAVHGLRAELLSVIAEWDVVLPDPLEDDTPLISSGAFDSVALFNLVLWVEEKTGRCIDPASVDLLREWDSVTLILQYLGQSPTAVVPPVRLRPVKRPVKHLVQRTALRAARIQIVRYAAEHKPAVIELQKRLWSPDANLNLRYFDWKYAQNPYATKPIIYLALAHGEVVGMRGFYPSRWEAGFPMQLKDVLVADDLVLREDHRNEGLVTQIMREALDDLAETGTNDYIFNLSGGRLTVLSSFAMGWRSPGSLTPTGRISGSHLLRVALRRHLARLPFLWRYADADLLSRRHPFRHLDHCLGAFTTSTGVAVSIAADPRPFAMARLVASQPYDGRLRHVRDEDYFHWRFRSPLSEHRFFYVGEDPLDGYLVVRCANPEARVAPRVHIIDMEARDERAGSALLDAVIRAGRFDELVVWSESLRPQFRAMLGKLKFEPADQHLAPYGLPRILVRPIDDKRLADEWLIHGVRLLDLENWDMRMIYSMAG